MATAATTTNRMHPAMMTISHATSLPNQPSASRTIFLSTDGAYAR
jgi:hypothetical protein